MKKLLLTELALSTISFVNPVQAGNGFGTGIGIGIGFGFANKILNSHPQQPQRTVVEHRIVVHKKTVVVNEVRAQTPPTTPAAVQNTVIVNNILPAVTPIAVSTTTTNNTLVVETKPTSIPIPPVETTKSVLPENRDRTAIPQD